MQMKEYLRSRRLVTDGAMGTYYEEKYGRENGLAERANEYFPDRIKEIHLEYLKSGARLLRTNTFASNRMFFQDMEEVEKNIRAAWQIAVDAVEEFRMEYPEEEVFIAADVGTLYDSQQMEYEQMFEEHRQICDIFLDCGAECFLFETQADFTYLDSLSRYIKEKADVFLIAQFSFDKSGYTRSGLHVEKMVQMMADAACIDAYGWNCGMGATHMYQLLQEVVFPNDKYVTALPNAGYPYMFRGKLLYTNNVPYFAEEMKKIAGLGIEIMGGCCGTTPEHIKAFAEALADMPFSKKRIGHCKEEAEKQTESERNRQGGDVSNESAGREQCSKYEFERKLSAGEKVCVVELDPPFQADIKKLIDGARELSAAGVDMLTISDSPMARARMDAGQLAVRIQQETNVPVMPHVCCRDKNVIALRSTLLGTYMNQIRHYLIVTGDPVAREDRDYVTSVFDFNSVKLMKYIQAMNEDVFFQEPVSFGGALNYHGANPDAIIRRMEEKIAQGCRYFLTQPIYTDEDVERIWYIRKRVDTKILCGIMPLVSYKNALFVKNEMPGMYVSDEIVMRYHPDMTREEAEKTAIAICVETAEKLMDTADGFYFMPPFNRTGLICRIMEKIKAKTDF